MSKCFVECRKKLPIKIMRFRDRMKLTDELLDFYESARKGCQREVAHEMWFKAIAALDIEGLLNREKIVEWLKEREKKGEHNDEKGI